MAKGRKRSTHRTKSERALEEIYSEIPSIPACTGECAEACGPIAMAAGEWERVKRSFGREPRLRPGSLVCPMLSPTGKCMVYTVRPFICRLWGCTKALRCPKGCEPERWISTDEAREIHRRIVEVAGPGVTGTLGGVNDLWGGYALEARERRMELMEAIKEQVNNDGAEGAVRPAGGAIQARPEPGGAGT